MRNGESNRLSVHVPNLEAVAPATGGGSGGSSSSSSASSSDHFSPSPFLSTQSSGGAGSNRSLPQTPAMLHYPDADVDTTRELKIHRAPPPGTSNPRFHGLDTGSRPPRAQPQPERPLIMLAMRVAVLEKTASNIGALSFLWATVVLLGGYATSMKSEDFWIVTMILVTEGFRIFSRSHELELQHQYTGSGPSSPTILITEACHSISRAFSTLVSPRLRHRHGNNTDSPPDLERQNGTAPIVSSKRRRRLRCFTLPSLLHSLFQARRISLFLYWLQIVSALVCVALSVWRLVLHDYLTPNESDPEHTHRSSLFIFYSLTLTEAAIFLAGRAYWQYNISVRKILKSTNVRCGLLPHDPDGHTVRRFFYDVYSTCLTDSVFEGLKMSLVNYAIEWLQSNGPEAHREHLLGLKALYAMASPPNNPSSEAAHLDQRRQLTLRAISTSSQGAVERLLDMLTWKNEEHRVIRDWAAMLLSKLVDNNVAGIRVGAISGSMEAISGLLAPQETHADLVDKELPSRSGGSAAKISWNQWMDPSSNHIAVLPHIPTLHHPSDLHVQLGLRILIKLAYKNEMVCAQIGATRGLLSRIVAFTDISDSKSSGGKHGYNIVLGLSLQLINDLTACNGLAGRTLRQDIAKVVLSIAHLRDILNEKLLQIDTATGTINQTSCSLNGISEGEYADLLKLKFLAADTLSNLAMDEEVRDMIGRTGGIMHTLFALFFIDLGGGGTATDPHANVSASSATAITHDPMDYRLKPHIHKLRVRIATVAGKALSLLSLPRFDNTPSRNCARMFRIRPQDILGERQLTSLNIRLSKRSSISSSTNLSANDSEAIDPKYSRYSIVDALIYGIGNYKLDPRGQHALFILRNFCESKDKCEFSEEYRMQIAQSITPQMLKLVIDHNVGERIKEAAIGLAAKTILMLKNSSSTTPTLPSTLLEETLDNAGTNKEELVKVLVEMLQSHGGSSIMKLPRLRRFCVELAISLVEVDNSFVSLFQTHAFGSCLRCVSASTSDIENFATFSGQVGLSLHPSTMEDLLVIAIRKFRLQDQLYI